MKVYIEYVLFDNLIIDYLLLKYTFLLTKCKSGFWRLLFCSFLGACFAIIMPLTIMPKILSIIVKLLFSICLVYSGAKFLNIKSFIFAALVFNLYTFILGGGIIGVFNVLCLPYDKDYSVGIIIVVAYAFIKVIHKTVLIVYKKKNVYAYVSDCEITLGETVVKTTGFLDTGNRLYDSETQNPVVLCSKKIAFELTNGLQNKINGKYLKITTAIGEDKIFVFKIDKLKIYNGDEPNIFNNIMLGISKQAFVENGYDLILHSELGGVSC